MGDEILNVEDCLNDEYLKYIYINPNSLSKDICQEIIEKYEQDENKFAGVTYKGKADNNIKETMDLVIDNDTKWYKIKKCLIKELELNIQEYIKQLNCSHNDYLNNGQNTTENFMFNKLNVYFIDIYMIQRYIKNKGKFIYHDDSRIDYESKKYRMLTYIWYLNDVDEGGETVFSGKYKVTPKTGKLVIFPATWTYPHCGKMPISNNKYIITGWAYSNIG